MNFSFPRKQKRIVVIAAPTAGGETTFTMELIDSFENFTRLTSATTRNPRMNEENGKDYYFFSKDEFFNEIDKGNIIEYTHVPSRDAYYGSYKPDLDKRLEKGLTVVVNTDLKGARFYKNTYNATTIFIKPKSIDVIRDRLTRRDKTISAEEVEKRVKQAEQEIFEAKNHYDYVVYNTDGEFANTLINVVEILKKEGYSVG